MQIPRELIERTKGFMDPAEGRRLFELAREAAPLGPCLEIGSYCGKSALYLGAGCREKGGVLFSLDHHGGSEEQQPGEEYFDPELFDPQLGRVNTLPFLQRTLHAAGLLETVIPVLGSSRAVARFWSTPLSLVFVDGGHAFETALNDYQCWAPHLVPGGLFVMHDLFPNPEDGGQAPLRVYEIAKGSGLFRELPGLKTLGILKRLSPGEQP